MVSGNWNVYSGRRHTLIVWSLGYITSVQERLADDGTTRSIYLVRVPLVLYHYNDTERVRNWNC